MALLGIVRRIASSQLTEDMLFTVEFKGNTAADNRPDPLHSPASSGCGDERDVADGESVDSEEDDSDVRQEMRRVLSDSMSANPD